MLRLFNTLTKKIEDFIPSDSRLVTFYGCGPTVYDHIHIGNCRSFLMYDLLRRVLQAEGFEVRFVQNITDIEDKIISRSKELNLTPQELTEKYTQVFFDDINKLNILPANNYPKATGHIGEIIKYIERLIEKKLAYVEQDGSVYFDVSEFSEYGKLSGVDRNTIKTGARVLSREARKLRLSDEYSKEDVQDFALWKSVETSEFGWDSPWGKGRPGWHIECSVMSSQFLGETIDIHAGGVDLIFPHHENEIAQSEGVTEKPFVKYWVHGEHLLVDGTKMSKSKNNFYTLKDIEDKGFEPLALRYLILTANYRDKLNFTWESLQASQTALENLRRSVSGWNSVTLNEVKSLDNSYFDKLLEALNNDLNSSQALAVLWEVVKNHDMDQRVKSEVLLKMDQVLGLGLDQYLGKKVDVPTEVMKLVGERETARAEKNFQRSDDLRKEVRDLGYEIEDSSTGPKVKKT